MNPDRRCNFDCVYCEVDRSAPPGHDDLIVPEMVRELDESLLAAHDGALLRSPRYAALPSSLLQLKHVALSGDGEPTLAENFEEAVHAVLHLRALQKHPPFKIVLITNTTGLRRPDVAAAVNLFSGDDEIWAKLEAGTQSWFERVNRPNIPLTDVLENIRAVGLKRPILIQSLFPAVNGVVIPPDEIYHFAQRIRELKESGTQIKLVQIYSADRPSRQTDFGHLPLRTLSEIASVTRKVAGVPTEVF